VKRYCDKIDTINILDVNAGSHGRYFSTNFDPEIKPDSKYSFDGTVKSLEKKLAKSTATVIVSAANPMIALSPGNPAKV